MMVAIERQIEKQERTFQKEAKDKMIKYYYLKYGIKVSEQTLFFTRADKLAEMLHTRAVCIKEQRAATKIQNWFRTRKNRSQLESCLIKLKKAISVIQRSARVWIFRHRINNRREKKYGKAVLLIQRVMRGYIVQTRMGRQILDAKCRDLHEYYRKINIIEKSHF